MQPMHGVTLFLGLALAATVNGAELPAVGGAGGDPFRVVCPSGAHLIGLSGRAGAWIDQLVPLCATWNAARQAFDAPVEGRAQGTSSGGLPMTTGRCPAGFAVTAAGISVNTKDSGTGRRIDAFVDEIGLQCAQVGGSDVQPVRVGRAGDAGGNSRWLYMSDRQACPAGQMATGIHGRAGLFIDAVGLICGPAPVLSKTAGAASDARSARNQMERDPMASLRSGPAGAVAAVQGHGCQPGYEWRMAGPSDLVCVPPESKARAAEENSVAPARVDPRGAFGPNSCIAGFVWREAFRGDLACVAPENRDTVRQENALAASRSKKR